MNEPVDTSKLDPATLARHLGNPEGEIGRAVIANLNISNAGGYSAALRKLTVNAGDRMIGFGNGREIPGVLSLAQDVSYFGLEISETMVADAKTFNAEAIHQGRVTLVHGTSATIPADPGVFSKALALNTIYFWPNPVTDLKELRRVLQSGGRVVLGALAPKSAIGAVFQHGFRLYEETVIEELLNQAGLTRVSIDTIDETVVPPTDQPWNRDYFIIAAE